MKPVDNEDNVLTGKAFKNKNAVKTLAILFKGNYKEVALSLVFYLIKHSPVLLMPIIVSNVINIATYPDQHDLHDLFLNIFLGALIVLQNLPMNVLYTKYLSRATRSVEVNLRSKMVRKLQMLSISFHKGFDSGRIHSKILRDVENITTVSKYFCTTIVPIIVNTIVAIIITLNKSPVVALFFILTIPSSAVIIRLFRRNVQKTNTEFRKELENMSANVSEMVAMLPVTKAHGLENVEIEKMDNKLYRVKNKGYSLDMTNAFFGASAWVTFQLFQVGCLLFTGYMAYTGKISVGDVVLFQSYFTTLLNQINALINVYPEVIKGFESVRSVGEIFQADDVEIYSNKKKLKNIEGVFDFQDLCFQYDDGTELILDNFNLHVDKGQTVAFVGESGSGKSTLLNLVIGFFKPTSGKILIDGEDLQNININEYRKSISVVAQNTVLFSGTIKENITYGMDNVSDEEIEKAIYSSNLHETIEKLPLGLETRVGEGGDMLSGGQKQRLAIARAIIRNPKIIILDEATSALDNKSEKHVQVAMDRLAENRTTFVVAHRLSTIENADKIVVVQEGKFVESGSYDELIAKKGAFYRLRENI